LADIGDSRLPTCGPNYRLERFDAQRVAKFDLAGLSVRELLALWAQALRELRNRGVVRTFNNPIGDIEEELVALYYGGERGSFSQKTWDVAVGEELLQVKALRRTRGPDATSPPCAPTRATPR
jgi:hypothetical protein